MKSGRRLVAKKAAKPGARAKSPRHKVKGARKK
jgi:hypothetical protein